MYNPASYKTIQLLYRSNHNKTCIIYHDKYLLQVALMGNLLLTVELSVYSDVLLDSGSLLYTDATNAASSSFLVFPVLFGAVFLICRILKGAPGSGLRLVNSISRKLRPGIQTPGNPVDFLALLQICTRGIIQRDRLQNLLLGSAPPRLNCP